MPRLTLERIKGDKLRNGTLRQRIAVVVDDETKTIEAVTLDSPVSKDRAANKWADRYGIEISAAHSELDRLALVATAEAQQRQQEREARPAPTVRVRELAANWLKTLGPRWHRNATSIYLDHAEREVPVAKLWTLAADTQIDAVVDTVEGAELYHDGKPPDYRKRLGLFREAVALATAQIVGELPEVEDAEDDTASESGLRDKLEGWLLRERSFRTDNGTPVTLTYFAWLTGLARGKAWQQCHTAAVFGRMSDDDVAMLATKGAVLAPELGYKTSKRLARDLRTDGYAETDRTIKVTGKTWRVWILTPNAIDAVATGNTKEA